MNPAEDSTVTETTVDHLAALLGLPIDPASRSNVTEHLGRLLAAAALVAELRLPDDVVPAPVFRP